MLRDDVCKAVEEGKFAVYSVETIDDGIELLTGMAAGQRDDSGMFPVDSINARVEAKLTEFSTRMHAYVTRSGSSGEKE